jgi:uncharacterized protein
MAYEWDDEKAAANLRKHSVSFKAVFDFDWSTTLIVADERADYGEQRWVAIGKIGERLYSLAYTFRDENI